MRKTKERGITLIALIVTIIALVILAAVSINVIFGEDGVIKRVQQAQEENRKAQALEEVKLAVTNAKIEVSTEDQENKKEYVKNLIEIELKKIANESTCTITQTGYDVNHKGYLFIISEELEVSIKSEFDTEEWDKDATSVDAFVWASNNPNDGDLYRTIIGYNSSAFNNPTLKIPSRCKFINANYRYLTDLTTSNSMGGWGTSYTSKITSIEIPETVEQIRGCFSYFTKVSKIELPRSIKYIGNTTFYGCESLNTIIYYDSIEYIGDSAFTNTSWYNNQPDGPIYIGKVLYKYKGSLPTNTTAYEIKDGTISIASGAFSNDYFGDSSSTQKQFDNLKEIVIPESLCFIDNYAFNNCTNLETITPKNGHNFENITYIGTNAFHTIWTGGWKSKWYENQPEGAIYIGKVLYSYKGTAPETVTIEDGIKTITGYAFYGTAGSNIKNIELPNSIEIIGGSAFYNCTNVENLKMSDNIVHIGEYAFYNCNKIQSIEFSNEAFHECENDIVDTNMKSGTIGPYAFYNCTDLTSVTIPNRTPFIGKDAFGNCPNLNLTSSSEDVFIWASNNPNDGDLYRTIIGFSSGIENYTTLKIPTRCKIINGNYTKLSTTGTKENTMTSSSNSSKYKVTSIEIPDTVEEIRGGFSYFKKLTSIKLPNSIKYIGEESFYGCENLNEIEFPDNVEYIAGSAFSNTSWYNNQPDGPIYIGKVLYRYKGTIEENTTLQVKDGTVSISSGAFSTINYGDSAATQALGNLIAIELPESLCFIDDNAFYKCINLETITGKDGYNLENITYIGENNFYGVTNTWSTKWYENQPEGPIYIGKVLYGYKGTAPETVTIKNGTRTITSYAFYGTVEAI